MRRINWNHLPSSIRYCIFKTVKLNVRAVKIVLILHLCGINSIDLLFFHLPWEYWFDSSWYLHIYICLWEPVWYSGEGHQATNQKTGSGGHIMTCGDPRHFTFVSSSITKNNSIKIMLCIIFNIIFIFYKEMRNKIMYFYILFCKICQLCLSSIYYIIPSNTVRASY